MINTLIKTNWKKVALIALLPSIAFADSSEEIAMLEKSKLSLCDAVAIAEKHAGGRALSASIEDDSFQPTYEVTVVKDNTVFDIDIDAVEGKVLGMREDRDD